MADVFINYARQDSEFAQQLAAGLKARGLSVWSDLDLRAGDQFVEVIQAALANSGCVLTVWSRHSVNSSWVQAEAQWAMKQGNLLPVTIDEAAIPPAFLTVQTIFLRRSERDWLDRLTQDVRHVVSRRGDRPLAPEPVSVKHPDHTALELGPPPPASARRPSSVTQTKTKRPSAC